MSECALTRGLLDFPRPGAATLHVLKASGSTVYEPKRAGANGTTGVVARTQSTAVRSLIFGESCISSFYIRVIAPRRSAGRWWELLSIRLPPPPVVRRLRRPTDVASVTFAKA